MPMAKPKLRPGIGRDHAGHRRVEHGRADGADRDKEQQHQERRGDAHQRDEDDGQQGAAEDKKPGVVVIGQIADRGLNHKSQQAVDPCDQTDLGEVRANIAVRNWQKRIEQRRREIAGEVHEE